MDRKKLHIGLLCSYLVVFVWSLIHPVNLLIWFLEVGPVILGGTILLWTYSKFQLSTLTYVVIWLTAIVMTVGGHYSYELVPLFNWIRDTFHLKRNHYDRLGHYIQGITVALLAREVLLRKSPLLPGLWLSFIVLCICLSFSASYELIEFAFAKIMGGSADLFLGLQGDVWDSQWDMLYGFLGALTGVLLLSRYQDRHIWSADR